MKIKKIKSIAIISAIYYFLAVNMTIAASKWTSPPKPKNVPADIELGLINLTNWVLGFISMVAVLFVIWGGAQYLTSIGDENRMEGGKKTITYALMGLVIAALAYGIINIIVSKILQ